jgi:hypothetical protein
MQQTFCDECGNEMEFGSSAGLTIEQFSHFGEKAPADITGDYCEDCADGVVEAVREVLSRE